MNILCKLGLHSMKVTCGFYPSINAKIVTEFVVFSRCSRCKFQEASIDHFHPVTGEFQCSEVTRKGER